MRNLEIIGEASGRLPEVVRQAAPEIEWRKVIGIRNILAHGYFGISLPIIWDVVQNKLDELSEACARLVSEPGDKDLGWQILPQGNLLSNVVRFSRSFIVRHAALYQRVADSRRVRRSNV